MVYVLLRIQPARAPKVRVPLDLYLALDRSGSMATRARRGSKLTKFDLLQEATRRLIEHLAPEDRIMLVAFDHTTTIVSPLGPAGDLDNRRALVADLLELETGGGTHLSTSLREIHQAFPEDPAAIQRIVLFTDGEVNYPSEDLEVGRCQKLARQIASDGAPFLAFGLGTEYKDSFLDEIATISGGTWVHLNRAEEAVPAFAQQFDYLAGVVATRLDVAVDLGPQATFQTISRVVPEIKTVLPAASNYLALRLGELDSARGQAILMGLRVEALEAGDHRLGTVKLTYDLPGAGMQGLTQELTIQLESTNDKSRVCRDDDVLCTARVEGAHRLQTVALELLQKGEQDPATRMLDQVANTYQSTGQTELAATVRTLSNAVHSGTESTGVRRTLTTASRLALTKPLADEKEEE